MLFLYLFSLHVAEWKKIDSTRDIFVTAAFFYNLAKLVNKLGNNKSHCTCVSSTLIFFYESLGSLFCEVANKENATINVNKLVEFVELSVLSFKKHLQNYAGVSKYVPRC